MADSKKGEKWSDRQRKSKHLVEFKWNALNYQMPIWEVP